MAKTVTFKNTLFLGIERARSANIEIFRNSALNSLILGWLSP